MATKRGMLGQSDPASGILTDIYTVPGGKDATVRVIITNRAPAASTFRVSVGIAGAADALKQYLAFDVPISENDTGSTTTFNVDAADVIRVQSASGSLSFSVSGVESNQNV